MKGHETFCSIAEAGKNSPIVKVEILANDGIAIPFTIIPLHIGEIPIEFVVNTETDSDRILKKLTVVVSIWLQDSESTGFLFYKEVPSALY